MAGDRRRKTNKAERNEKSVGKRKEKETEGLKETDGRDKLNVTEAVKKGKKMSDEKNRMKESQRQPEVDGVTGQISGRRGHIYLPPLQPPPLGDETAVKAGNKKMIKNHLMWRRRRQNAHQSRPAWRRCASFLPHTTPHSSNRPRPSAQHALPRPSTLTRAQVQRRADTGVHLHINLSFEPRQDQ